MALVIELPGMVPSLNEIRRMNRWRFSEFVNEWKGTTTRATVDAVNRAGWQAPDHALVTVLLAFGDKRRHDPDNYTAGLKGLMDGLTAGKAIVDDDFAHITLRVEQLLAERGIVVTVEAS